MQPVSGQPSAKHAGVVRDIHLYNFAEPITNALHSHVSERSCFCDANLCSYNNVQSANHNDNACDNHDACDNHNACDNHESNR